MKNTLDEYMFTSNVHKDIEFASILKELRMVKVNITSHKSTIPYIKISLDEPGNQNIYKCIINIGLINTVDTTQKGGGDSLLKNANRNLLKQIKLNLLASPLINSNIPSTF